MSTKHLFGFIFAIVHIDIRCDTANACQAPQAPPDMTIDAATRTAVIDVLLKELNDSYVFAETAKKMEADIRSRLSAMSMTPITSARDFAAKLTADLQSVSKDKHLRVRYFLRQIS
jgi:hypothetical protein